MVAETSDQQRRLSRASPVPRLRKEWIIHRRFFCVVGTPICPHLPVPPQPSKASLKRPPELKDQPKRAESAGAMFQGSVILTRHHMTRRLWILDRLSNVSSGPSRLVNTPHRGGEVSDDGSSSTMQTMCLRI
jgi:hypothetical protein